MAVHRALAHHEPARRSRGWSRPRPRGEAPRARARVRPPRAGAGLRAERRPDGSGRAGAELGEHVGAPRRAPSPRRRRRPAPGMPRRRHARARRLVRRLSSLPSPRGAAQVGERPGGVAAAQRERAARVRRHRARACPAVVRRARLPARRRRSAACSVASREGDLDAGRQQAPAPRGVALPRPASGRSRRGDVGRPLGQPQQREPGLRLEAPRLAARYASSASARPRRAAGGSRPGGTPPRRGVRAAPLLEPEQARCASTSASSQAPCCCSSSARCTRQ